MYNMHKTKDRIKDLCKSQNIKMETLLADCGLGVNAIRQINEKKGMGSYSLARIADYLNCSVDYLLGRTDEPSAVSNVIGGNVTGSTVMQESHNSNVTVNSGESNLTDEEKELLRLFKSFDVKQRIKVLNLAFSLENEPDTGT